MLTKKDITPISFGILLLGLFYAIRIFSPLIVEYLYRQQSFEFLNAVCRVTDNKPLDFYKGEWENFVFGPLASVLSGGLFLAFCLRYLKKASGLQFSAAVFLYLILTRPEVLLNPPFGEGITGPFSDVIWLIQNSLNYLELLRQDTFTKGGPQIYPTALYPLFLAVLMKLLPTKVFLFVMHALTFAMAATIVSIIRKFAAKFLNEENALACAILLLSLPLFQAMVELINLEMPCTFFVVLTAYYLLENKYFIAGIMSILALFTKDPGVIACGLVFLYAIKHAMAPVDQNKRWPILIWVFGIMIFVIAKSTLRAVIIGEQKVYAMIAFLSGWHNVVGSVWFYLYLISCFIIIITLIRDFRKQDACSILTPGPFSLRDQVLKTIDARGELIVAMIAAGAFFLLYLNFLTMCYRYQLLLIPFFILTACAALSFIFRREKTLLAILTALIFFALASSHGLMYFRKFGVPESNTVECAPTNLERGLEYRNYLRLEMALAKEINDHYSDNTIVAPFQTAQLLALPELGYVTKKMDVVVYGMRETLGIKPYLGWQELDPGKAIWIGFPHHRFERLNILYPIDPHDQVLKKLFRGHIEVDIFRGGIAIERMRLFIENLRQLQLNHHSAINQGQK